MAAKRTRSAASSPAAAATPTSSVTTAPRLGLVVRFAPQAAAAGVKQLEASGMKVASSGDFRKAKAVPSTLGGADVQYFERFGIAIVRGVEAQARAESVVAGATDRKMVEMVRAERIYRALGLTGSRDYLMGYRDGVNHLIDRMLAGEGAGAGADQEKGVAAAVRSTWGLAATGVSVSRLTGAGIKVAVLDTGFDHTHPDFLGRRITKKSFVTNSTDGDVVGHGTHCIGTACGPLKPAGTPRYGVAYEAEIFAGKVLGDDGKGTDRSIIAGMEWALEQGCHIISLSLGAETFIGDQPSDEYEDIGRICLDAGALVVAAAGNESARPGVIAPVGSPANASTFLAVAAVDRAMRIAEFSCGGLNTDQNVDIAGPGVGVRSCVPGGGHRDLDGTSMATPHVAGIAALIAQSDPRYRGWALWARVLQTARRLSLPARDVGKGLVRAPRG
jgi:subtilisin family serine protease